MRAAFFPPLYEVWGSPKKGVGADPQEPPWIQPSRAHPGIWHECGEGWWLRRKGVKQICVQPSCYWLTLYCAESIASTSNHLE